MHPKKIVYCNLNLTDGSLSQSFIVSHGDGGAVCVAWFRLDCEWSIDQDDNDDKTHRIRLGCKLGAQI